MQTFGPTIAHLGGGDHVAAAAATSQAGRFRHHARPGRLAPLISRTGFATPRWDEGRVLPWKDVGGRPWSHCLAGETARATSESTRVGWLR